MDEFAAGDGDADVRSAGSDRREEDQISWLDRAAANTATDAELLVSSPRYEQAVLGKDVGNEPAAIET